MTTDERIDRLERAIAELAAGVDWSSMRARFRPDALREIQAERHAAEDARELDQRQAALRAELAALTGGPKR